MYSFLVISLKYDIVVDNKVNPNHIFHNSRLIRLIR